MTDVGFPIPAETSSADPSTASPPAESPPVVPPAAPEPAPVCTSIGVFTLWRVLWRSFFFQAAANYERMQNVGFAYAMAPALARLYTGEARVAALKRHLGFFNSHPYLSTAIIGASIRIEMRVAAGKASPLMVEAVKRMAMGPLAAIGDSFFWSSLRPFACVWAAVGLLMGVPWAPLAALALYNLFHLSVRLYGLTVGYRAGETVLRSLNTTFHLGRYGELAHWGSGLVLGVVGAALSRRAALGPLALGGGVEPVLFAAFVAIFFLCIRRKIPTIGLLYGGAIVLLCYVVGLDWLFPLVDVGDR